MNRYICLGFDSGGTKSAVLVADTGGRILCREESPTGAPRETLEKLFEIASRFPRAALAGISCGGPLDEGKGLILSPPNLPGWDRVPITEMVSRRFGIPTALMNDADAGALAEWRFGAGRGCESLVFLTFGTGLGAGLVLGGRRYRGASGYAGELGHIRLADDGPVGYGKRGSFEGFASGGGIAQSARAAALRAIERGETVAYASTVESLASVSAKTVAEAAFAGDPTAIEVYREAGRRLGQGLAIVVDLVNPERILLGGVFLRAEALLRPSMEEVLARECLPGALSAVTISPTGLGESIGDYAALSVAMTLIKD